MSKLTTEEAAKILEKYGIEAANVDELIQEHAEDIEAATFTGGNQIDSPSCTTNNVCRGC